MRLNWWMTTAPEMTTLSSTTVCPAMSAQLVTMTRLPMTQSWPAWESAMK